METVHEREKKKGGRKGRMKEAVNKPSCRGANEKERDDRAGGKEDELMRNWNQE